jgi:hypothetical protein
LGSEYEIGIREELERGKLERGKLERGKLERGKLERGKLERVKLESSNSLTLSLKADSSLAVYS